MKLFIAVCKWLYRLLSYKWRMERKLDGIITSQTDIERRVLRLEILSAMRRKDKLTVYALYDEYKNKYNGNSYMDELFVKFKKGTRK